MSTSLFYTVCEELRDISTNRKATRAQQIEAKEKRARHRAFIRELRLRYHEDCQRALVAQEWRKNVRGEYVSDASLHQKLQTVLNSRDWYLVFCVYTLHTKRDGPHGVEYTSGTI